MSQEIHELELQVCSLEKDVENSEKHCSEISQKITASIEKLQEVNVNVVRMITIHDLKHEQHDKTEEELKDSVKELHSRITTVNREMQDRLLAFENTLTEKIDELKTALTVVEPKKKFFSLSSLDKYAYLIIGGLAVIGWILMHLQSITKLFTLF